jgi:membrane associated rhomboid family serine protease
MDNLSVTTMLIIVNCVVSFFALNNPEVMNRLILTPYWVERKKEYYRFITSGFIHASFLHLAVNMLSLYFFGEIVEQWLGTYRFIILYMAAIVISDIPTYLKYKNNSYYASLGASGAVSAVVFASIMFHPLNDICLYAFICMPAFVFGALYLGYSYYMDKRSGDAINHSAHFYGAAVGLVFVGVLYPHLIPEVLSAIFHWRPEFLR